VSSAKAGVRSSLCGMDGRRALAPNNISRMGRRQKRKGSIAMTGECRTSSLHASSAENWSRS